MNALLCLLSLQCLTPARSCHAVQLEIKLNLYKNGTSTETRRDNWEQLYRVCKKVGGVWKLPDHLVQQTVAMLPGAAMKLLEYMYEMCTGKRCDHR